VTDRPWYKQARAKKSVVWSTLSTFASSSPSITYSGLTYAFPTYNKMGGLDAVFGADISGPSLLQKLISTYAEFCYQAYVVYYLVMSTTGEYGKTSLIKASDSVNDVTSSSASYLTNRDTLWRADGDYALTIGSKIYNVNLRTYTDATSSVVWRIVVVGEPTDVTVDYKPTIHEAMAATKVAITDTWSYVQSITKAQVFLHGKSDKYPYATPLMSVNAPANISPTQHEQLEVYKSFYNVMIVS
jgi:hypothetical protein